MASALRVASSLLVLGTLACGASADESLWSKLAAESDLVVLMRHAKPAGGDPLLWDATGDCKGESMLSAQGIAHAKRIGEAFAARGIKPKVITSPMCRCRDSARIAFGADAVTDPNLREVASADAKQARAFEATAQALIASRRGRAPVVFVSHRPNIDLLTMELLDEGELLVGRADAAGAIDVLGKLRVP
jgi:phosphohistidine phosphatase SixA